MSGVLVVVVELAVGRLCKREGGKKKNARGGVGALRHQRTHETRRRRFDVRFRISAVMSARLSSETQA